MRTFPEWKSSTIQVGSALQQYGLTSAKFEDVLAEIDDVCEPARVPAAHLRP